MTRPSLAAASLCLLAACVPTQAEVLRPALADLEARTGLRADPGQDERDPALRERVRQRLADGLSLEEAIEIALMSNPRVGAAFAGLGEGRAALAEASVLENPEVELELRFPVDDGDGTTIEVGLSQEVTGLITLRRRRVAARAELGRSQQRAVAAAVDLVGEVREAYVEAQASQQVLEMRQVVYQASQAGWELAQRLYQAGNVTALELAQEQAQYEQARLDLAQAEVFVVEARERLNGVLGLGGRDAGAWTLDGRLPELPEGALALDELEAEAVAASLDLEELRWEMRAAGGSLDVARLERWLPEVGVGAAAEREDDGAWSVGPAVSFGIPLFDRRQGALVRGEARLVRARKDYAERAVALRAAARAARARLLHARARAAHLRDVMLPLRQTILEQSMLQYNAMNLSLFSLLQARREQVETGRQYIEALRDYWLARNVIEQLRAGRTPSPLAPPSRTNSAAAASAPRDH